MTVLDNAPRDQYTATSGQTVFPYTFEIAAAGDIKVLQNGTLINQGAGAGEYAVSGVGVDTGGNVTLVTGATTGDVLTIYRDMALERLTAYTNAGDFLAADVNNDFDRLWLALQQNGGDLDGRVLIAPNTDPTSIDMTIPAKADRLGKYLRFNDTTGNPEAGDAAGLYTSAGLNNYNFTGDGATVNFTLGMEPGGENNTQVYIDGVYQQKDTYNVSGAVVQFSAAPPNLSTIEVMVVQVLPVGSTTASQVSFTQAGSTYGRNVQLKLQESVSVQDFGAIGDNSTDDTTAIQNAMNAVTGGTLLFEKGKTYKVTESLVMQPSTIIELNGSILSFDITGKKRCLVTKNYCTVRNGTVRNVTTDSTVYGAEWGQPVCIGFSDGLTDGVHDVLAENLTITSTSPEGNAIFVFGESYNIVVRNITIPDSAYLGEPIGGHWSVEPGGDETQGTGHPNNILFSNIYVGSMSYATSQAVCFLSACRAVRLENIYCKDIENGDLVQVYAGDHGFAYSLDATAQQTGSMVSANNIHGKCRSAFRVDMRDTLESQDVWPSSISFENCNVLARSNTDSDAKGVRVAGTDGVRISNCQFDSFYNSVFLDSEVTNLVVRDSFFKRSYKNAVDADNSLSCQNLEFTNNKFFSSNTSAGTGYDMAFGSYIEDITVSENIFNSPSVTYNLFALDSAPPSNMKITNNHVSATGGTCFVLGLSASTGICSLFTGNSVGQTVTSNLRGGQEYVPYNKTAYKNTALEINHYVGASTPSYGTYNAGDIVFDDTPSAGGTIGTVCVVSGTQGTYSEGRTATTDGTTSVVLSTASNVLKRGDYVTINSTDVRINSISGTAVVVSATIAAGAGLAIAYDNATFKTFGSITA